MNFQPVNLPVFVPPWVVWSGWAVACLGAAVFLWALGGDFLCRLRRGRAPRCPRCWYSMAGVQSLTCPECGRPARSPGSLLRSRRRWGWASVSLLAAGAGAAAVTSPRWLNTGLIPHAPGRVLIWLVEDPTASPGYQQRWTVQHQIAYELWRRCAEGGLSPEDRRALASKQFADGRSPLTILTRKRWPAGVPIRATLRKSFEGTIPRDLRAPPPFPGGEPIIARQASRWMPGYEWIPGRATEPDNILLDLGLPPPDATQIRIDAQIRETGWTVWSGSLVEPIQVGGAITDVIAPVRDPALDERLRLHFVEGLSLSADGRWLRCGRLLAGKHEDLPAVGVHIEILFDDEPVASLRTVLASARDGAEAAVWRLLNKSSEQWEPLRGDTARLAAADLIDPHWQVRITGDGEASLWDFGADRFWAGRFTLPGSVLGNGEVRLPLP